jgi:hypothetical protein
MPGTVRGLAWALANVDYGPDWPQRLNHHLDHLHQAFHEHVRETEGDNGAYAEVVHAAPRLARGIRMLAGDHERLTAALAALRCRLESGASAADLRLSAAELLEQLDRHRQRGIDLLYEAYSTDIGGET